MYFPTIHSLPTAPRLAPRTDIEDTFSTIPELLLDSDSDCDTPSWGVTDSSYSPRPQSAIRPRDLLFGTSRRRKNADKRVRFAEEVTTFTYEAEPEEEEHNEEDPLQHFLEPVARNEGYPRAQVRASAQSWDPTGWSNLGIPVPLDFYSGIVRFGRGAKRERSYTATNVGAPRLTRNKTTVRIHPFAKR
ncbi:hypothetical protein BJ508DRAFT_51922 [Ascobolus immersus RN42]|uniref:Uncharacterized protein n=1 Tax=Ascobolus immersus RN42 TaxID=1160509 RepID=A0A3N4II77_ASCIM|nr:hypothetical protein BJ508DRAFT_51922 [Ascobolus immersus RN42]